MKKKKVTDEDGGEGGEEGEEPAEVDAPKEEE